MGVRFFRNDSEREIAAGTAEARGAAAGLTNIGTGEGLISAEDLGVGFYYDLADAIEATDEDIGGDEPEMVVVYKTQHDDRVRPEHAALHNTQWDPSDPDRPIPPLGHGCRCFEVLEAKTPKAAKQTGLPKAERNPPNPGGEALRQFFDGAETADGEQVTTQDILGKTVGDLVEQDKIPVEAALDGDGNAQKATVAKGIAKEGGTMRAARVVERAALRLQGFGLTLSTARGIAAAARTLAAKDGITQLNALVEVLVDQLPGFVSARTEAGTRRRARRVAEYIMQLYGGSL
jgi:hypothetical protein